MVNEHIPIERTLPRLLSKKRDKYRVIYDSARLEIIEYARRGAFAYVGGPDFRHVPAEKFDATVKTKVAMGVS